ncbi:MAG: diguanylate cyclase [Pseudomonadaceae bacterium]|nr:diguanylate cyclase [Pseudomonadaceae bacterium]
MRNLLIRLIKAPYSLFLPFLLWAFVIGLIYLYNSENLDNAGYEMARQRGEVAYKLVENIRHWNAEHGGVYAPITKKTPENRWLEAPEKTIESPQGVVLTKVNPAYMTRQLADLMRGTDLEIHLTSDRLINPSNEPDQWEAAALHKLKNSDLAEHIAIVNGKFRYMAPLYITEGCMSCHAVMGYKLGDFRGGLSVSFPVDDVKKFTAKLFQESRTIHCVAFILLSLTGVISMLALRRLVTSLQEERSQRETIIVERTASLNSEIEERRKSQQQLNYLAHHDELTGVKNRRWILKELHSHMTEHSSQRASLAVLLLDIDFFKKVNDSYGHETGDKVLCGFAEIIQTHLRQQDSLGRYGGEEFLVLLPATELNEAQVVAKRLREAVAGQTYSYNELLFKITTSIGIALYLPEDDLSPEELISQADEALYQAKASGRNCCKVWQKD